jgi:lipopolysaccharide heptosyltransferase II
MNPARILVTRIDRIGDVVLTTPALEALRRAFPEAWIAVLVRKQTRELVEGNPFINEVIAYDKEGAEGSWFGAAAFSVRLRRKRFDTAIHFHPTVRMHCLSWLAGIPVRIGFRRKAAWLLTHAVEERKREGLRSEASYNFDLLRVLNVSEPGRLGLFFPLREEEGARFDSLAREAGMDPEAEPYAVLNPSASCPSKIWPAARFAEVADFLWEQYRLRCVLIGAEQDRERSVRVRESARHPVLDLTGRLSLGMLGQALKKSQILISNDSGPVHIAAAVGTPVLSIFGRNESGLSARRWAPLGPKSRWIQKDVGCYFCLAHDCRIGFLCLRALTSGEVFGAVRAMEPFFLSEARLS